MSNEVSRLRDLLINQITKHQDDLYRRLAEKDVLLFSARDIRQSTRLVFTVDHADAAVVQANTALADNSVLIAVRYDVGNARFIVSKMLCPSLAPLSSQVGHRCPPVLVT